MRRTSVGKGIMKNRFFLLLLLVLLIAGCAKKEEAPAQPSAEPATSSVPATPDQNAQAAPTPSAGQKAALKETVPAEAKVAPKPPEPIVIPANTAITVRTSTALGSERSQTGDSFPASLEEPIMVAGKVAVPKGADITGRVMEAKKKGSIQGEARLKLTLTGLTVNGNNYPIQTTMTGETAKGKGKRTAATTAGGAGLGAIIGGIAGGGKGAAIGAAVGGGAGFVGGAFTGNKQIELPAESVLVFKLNEPITLK